MWYAYLQDYFKEYAYPQEGAAALLALTDRISRGSKLWTTLTDGVHAYESGTLQTFEELTSLLARIKADSAAEEIPSESAELLFFLLCMKHLKVLYEHLGLPQRYYDGVAADLLAKLKECYAVKGIWGSFVAPWFGGFFALTRFAIGRLQYEIIQMPACISADGKHCFSGEPAINMHIPSGRPLIREEVHASMAEAAQFFAHHFPGKQVLFHCNSWLLFPGHYQMLPESSGIRQFMEEFTIIRTDTHEDKHDLWRLFETLEVENLSLLPQDTSLRRNYIQWMQNGKPVGSAIGIRYYPIV